MKEVHLCMFFKKLHGGKNVITKNNVLIVYMAESEFNLLDRKAKQLKTTKSEVAVLATTKLEGARTATKNYIHNVNLSNEKLLQILKELRNLAYEVEGDLRDPLIYKLIEVDLHLY